MSIILFVINSLLEQINVQKMHKNNIFYMLYAFKNEKMYVLSVFIKS